MRRPQRLRDGVAEYLRGGGIGGIRADAPPELRADILADVACPNMPSLVSFYKLPCVNSHAERHGARSGAESRHAVWNILLGARSGCWCAREFFKAIYAKKAKINFVAKRN